MYYRDLYKIKARPWICLLLFAAGAALCLLLDLCGVPSISTEPILQRSFTVSVSAWLIVPACYAAAGIIIGALSKDTIRALIYGAALGQCQFLIPLIAFYGFHLGGEAADIWWRAICGTLCAVTFAGIASAIRQAIIKAISKSDK